MMTQLLHQAVCVICCHLICTAELLDHPNILQFDHSINITYIYLASLPPRTPLPMPQTSQGGHQYCTSAGGFIWLLPSSTVPSPQQVPHLAAAFLYSAKSPAGPSLPPLAVSSAPDPVQHDVRVAQVQLAAGLGQAAPHRLVLLHAHRHHPQHRLGSALTRLQQGGTA
jgi:hypothetical protein